MTLIKAFEALPDGKRLLASARLRRNIVKELRKAETNSGKSRAEIARELGKTRSAVSQVFSSNGNLKIDTLSDYFFILGATVSLKVEYSEVSSSLEKNMPWYSLEKYSTSSEESVNLAPDDSQVFEANSGTATIIKPNIAAWNTGAAA